MKIKDKMFVREKIITSPSNRTKSIRVQVYGHEMFITWQNRNRRFWDLTWDGKFNQMTPILDH